MERKTPKEIMEVRSQAGLVALARRMEASIDICDRSYLFTTYEHCFKGTHAVDWMMKAAVADSEDAALDLGNQMIKAGSIHSAPRDCLVVVSCS